MRITKQYMIFTCTGHSPGRLLGASPHFPPLTLKAPLSLFLPLPPHFGGGLLPGIRLVRHGTRFLEKTYRGLHEKLFMLF
jgi:hypothetical protein